MKNYILYISFILLLSSCQSVKDGLTGKKRSDTNDEFFVIKKNPLTMPPDYDKLPDPEEKDSFVEENEEDIQKILKKNKKKEETKKNSKSTTLEKSILEKIND